MSKQFVREVQQLPEFRVARDHLEVRAKQRHSAWQIVQKDLENCIWFVAVSARVVRDQYLRHYSSPGGRRRLTFIDQSGFFQDRDEPTRQHQSRARIMPRLEARLCELACAERNAALYPTGIGRMGKPGDGQARRASLGGISRPIRGSPARVA